jgi:membrane protease YdiL (CAAX protease family)
MRRWGPLLGTIVLANIFWFISFSVSFGSFWIKISLSAATLAFIAKVMRSKSRMQGAWDKKTLCWGIGSACVLYSLFWIGNIICKALFPFAETQIARIYTLGTHTPLWLMVVLALLITGPSEEYYWRGFVQNQLMDRFEGWQGWLLGALLYGSVHIWSFNVMLIGAACVAGAFWGLLYWYFGKLRPVIISHSVWSVLVFAVFPFA